MKKLFTFENIYKNYINCRKNKRNTINALKFEINLEENLIKLQEDLINKKYRPGSSICFVVEKPKLREIFAADFKDRIVHHILIDYLEYIYERKFIYHSYACRKNKGTHKAIRNLQSFLKKITKNGIHQSFYLQADIHNYFMSIDKHILFKIIKRNINNKDILWLTQIILFHKPAENYILKGKKELINLIPRHKSLITQNNNKGLPIGNLTSQFFGNLYLNELDQFIKHKLKIRYYIRYMDDFIILNADKEKLQSYIKEIDIFLSKQLSLKLNPTALKIQPVSNGINFLGYILRENYLLIRKRVVNNFKIKLENYKKKLITYKPTYCIINYNREIINEMQAIISSYKGHFKHGNTFKLRKKIITENSFLKLFFDINKDFTIKQKFKIKKSFIRLKDQYYYFQKKFPNSILFYQIGAFYEFYNKQAEIMQSLTGLNLKQNYRGFNYSCGFSLKYKDYFIKKLIQKFKEKLFLYINKQFIKSIVIIKETIRLKRIKQRIPEKVYYF